MAETGVPANDEIIEMIPSRAVKAYLRKIGHEFSEHDRELLRIYLAPKDTAEMNELWERGNYVSLPHPFRRGDIVACYGDFLSKPRAHEGKYELGIMMSFDDDADWAEWDKMTREKLAKSTDFSDVSTTVDFIYPDGEFSHNHPNPIQLEFASDVENALEDGTPKTEFLEAAAELVRGEGSLEWLGMTKRKYLRSAEHCLELLELILSEVKEYAEIGFALFLAAKNKEDRERFLWRMEYNVQYIAGYVDDIAEPLRYFAENANDEQKMRAKELLREITESAERAIREVVAFGKSENATRKMFFQGRLRKSIERLLRLCGKFGEIEEKK